MANQTDFRSVSKATTLGALLRDGRERSGAGRKGWMEVLEGGAHMGFRKRTDTILS